MFVLALSGKVNAPAVKKTLTCNSKIINASEYKFSFHLKFRIDHAPEHTYFYFPYFPSI